MGLCEYPTGGSELTRIYKILARRAWEAAREAGTFLGSPIDIADGFIHFSTAAQSSETARRHFAGQVDLVVLGVDAEALGPALLWEVSRGGDHFPHLYAELPVDRVIEVIDAPLDPEGIPRLGDLAP